MATKKDTTRIITISENRGSNNFAYVRVSSIEQNEARQLEALKDYRIHKIFVEKLSGKDMHRPLLKQLQDTVRDGDTIYVLDFSRLARNTKELLAIVEQLKNDGVTLISLKEKIDTSSAVGKLFITILAAIYEFERTNGKERQMEGVALAVKEGKYKGRKKIDKPDDWNNIFSRYMERKITAESAMEKLGIKRNTFYKWKKEELEKQKAEDPHETDNAEE